MNTITQNMRLVTVSIQSYFIQTEVNSWCLNDLNMTIGSIRGSLCNRHASFVISVIDVGLNDYSTDTLIVLFSPFGDGSVCDLE